MFFRKAITLYIVLLLSTFAGAQTAVEKEPTEKTDKLRAEAVVFLRETLADVNGMRSIENRISFTAELAALMWFHDEREARSMYLGAIAQFKDLIGKYESRMNELGTPDDDEQGEQAGPFIFDPSDRMRLIRKFTVAMGVRQQIALSIAEHDPELAFTFYYDSLSMVANPALREQIETKESSFESQLLTQLAEKDPVKAAKFARKAIEHGVTLEHFQLLKKIYAKDPDGGREFGLAILSSVKNEKFDGLYVISSLIEFGEETLADSKKPNGKRAAYTEPELRELAEVMAQHLLNKSTENFSEGQAYVATVQKYLPGRAAQIRTKFKMAKKSTNSNTNAAHGEGVSVVSGEDYDGAIVTSASNTDAATRKREEREKAEKQLFEDVQGLATKQLPKEERNKIVAQARKIIATTRGRDKKITALSMLAAQVAKLGDKELASEIMRDAERLVNPAPKNFQDFMLSWMLASGYASADPEKAFPILEETIGRANEVLGAVVKIGEFIDVNEDYIIDGEVQVGAFGGQMVRGLTRELNMADAMIEVLAKADFGKTKILTNRFDRPELRVLAKMMVLRTVLSPKPATTPEVPPPSK